MRKLTFILFIILSTKYSVAQLYDTTLSDRDTAYIEFQLKENVIDEEIKTDTSTETSLNRRQQAIINEVKFIRPYKFFENSKEYNRSRVLTASIGIGATYAATSIWWSAAWYSKYERDKFKFFDDSKEWLQMDKAAHIFNAYFLSKWAHNTYRWAGVDKKHAPWIGMVIGNLWQLSIEINDGFSKEWGFSWSDIGANLTGTAIFGLQQYLWNDQKFNIKISAAPVKYPKELRARTDQLYGTTFGELVLKDYNAMTFWLNASPGAFIQNPDSKFPKWISVSFGYSGTGMLGGFNNIWCGEPGTSMVDCPTEQIIDRSDIRRVRQYYLSLDIDFTKIPTNKPALKTFFELINIIKVPFPAVEFRSDGKVKWNWYAF